MKKYLSIILLSLSFGCSLGIAEKEPDLFILPRYEFLETPVFDVLHQVLGENMALVFLPEDTMKMDFVNKVGSGKYKCYIYYDRATQISGPTGGGFSGDFIEQAVKNLGDVIDGIIIPILTEQNTRSLIAANNIVAAYQETIREAGDLNIIFLCDSNLLSTMKRLDGYKANEFEVACIARLDRGKYISTQKKFFKKNSKDIPEDFIWSCDLRVPNTRDSNELVSFFDIFKDKKKLVVFENTEDSINAFAVLLDYLSKNPLSKH